MSREAELIRGKINEKRYAEWDIKGKKAKLKNTGYSGDTYEVIQNMRAEAIKKITHIDTSFSSDVHYLLKYGLDSENYYPMSAIAEILE